MKLLLKKVFPKSNGNDNESVAIKSYVDYYSKMGKSVVVNSRDLSVHPGLLQVQMELSIYDATEEHWVLRGESPFSCQNMLFDVTC